MVLKNVYSLRVALFTEVLFDMDRKTGYIIWKEMHG